MLTIGSLFSGIGGLELGLERAGLGRVVWQCEQDSWCRQVLARHWPGVRRYDDVCTMGVGEEVEHVDIICGGFPCTDLSVAGKGAGLDGARSGLFFEVVRLVRLVRPWLVVLENVAALIARGMERVVGELVAAGYDVTWSVVSAAAVGAPHRRERVFIVACLPDADGLREPQPDGTQPQRRGRTLDSGLEGGRQDMADAEEERRRPGTMPERDEATKPHARGSGEDVGNGNGPRLEIGAVFGGDAGAQLATAQRAGRSRGGVWCAEPGMGRGADGLPGWLDRPAWERGLARTMPGVKDRSHRLKALGNAVVPQVAEWVARRILGAVV